MMKSTSEAKTILRVSKYLFKYKALFSLTLGFAFAMTFLEISVPIAIQTIFDQIEQSGSVNNLWRGILIIGLLYLGSEIFNCLRIRSNNSLEQKVLFNMRQDIHSKLLSLPVAFYDKRKTGELASRVIEDVAAVERALLDGTEQGLSSILKIVGISVALFIMQPSLALCVFIPVPIILYVGIRYAKKSRKVWKAVRESASDLNSLIIEDIQGNRLIQSFGLENREKARFETKANDLKDKNIQAMFRWAYYSPVTTLITKLGFLSIVGIGGFLVLFDADPNFSIGKLIAFFLLANMLYQPIAQLHGLNHLLAAGRASGERVFEILDAKIDVPEAQNPVEIKNDAIDITFENVNFKYPERETVISNLNLTIEKNKVTALVGHTGAGKSTIANLAMRTYDVQAGTINFAGKNIQEISLKSLHDHIGFVAQDPFLFDGTIRDNLILGKPEATETEIHDALEKASAYDFVSELPDGLETRIGEKGIRLSQGEKQRITIARVLLKNPPFVVLDEATASVDTITEKKIQKALEYLSSERTVLIIAHRLSTVKKADTIAVLDRGNIIEKGTHTSLLEQKGTYSKLWEYQSDWIPESPNS
jgi:ABC-type multidrug transport system fused ATPase/permease subunit